MGIRTKILAAFLAGMVFVSGALVIKDYVAAVNFRLDRIENYLAVQELQRQMQHPAPEQQSGPERSHKGELSKPERWKV